MLPQRLAETEAIAKFLAGEVSTNTYLNIMAQYHPCYKAVNRPPLSRSLLDQEFHEAIDMAQQQGLNRLDKHSFTSLLRLMAE